MKGVRKAIQYRIAAVNEPEGSFSRQKIGSSMDAANYCRQFFSDDILIYESFFIMLLNRANEVIAWAKISQGGVVGTVCDPKIILKYVVDSLACGIILCHNHPSGTTRPSDADKFTTNKLKEALNLVDSQVLDHIILTEDSYFSFADDGLL